MTATPRPEPPAAITPYALYARPHDLLTLLVEVAFGVVVWGAALAAFAFVSPRIPTDLCATCAACGVAAGAAAAVIGWMLGRRVGWWLILDLPVGGAFVTAVMLAFCGAALGWRLPYGAGAGQILQAVLSAVLAAAFGAAIGALLGLVAALPASGLIWLIHGRRSDRPQGT
jgi:hypothetical protein